MENNNRRRMAAEKEYPPPLRWLPLVMKRYYTDDGRLVIKEERVKHCEYFQSRRSNGRLVLNLVHLDEQDDDGGGGAKDEGIDGEGVTEHDRTAGNALSECHCSSSRCMNDLALGVAVTMSTPSVHT